MAMAMERTGSHHASQGSRSTINVTVPSEHSLQQLPRVPNPIGAAEPAESQGVLSDRDVSRILATRILERAWCSYRDRQMFRLLKHAVCAAEHSLSHEILRKVCPSEAQFLRDSSVQVRVRFRFGGTEFPPFILFKIYMHTGGQGVKYISGKKCIRPASEAAEDACRLMGHRNFYDQMITDACQHDKSKITDEIDVTTMKDYMQYLSNLDELPATLGGKDNHWRKLDLSALPRTTILYDIVDYMRCGSPSDRLRKEMPLLMARPITQEIQLAHIRTISQLRSIPITPAPTPKSGLASRQSIPGLSARRSRQAKERAYKMRQVYTMPLDHKQADGDIENSFRREKTVPANMPGKTEDIQEDAEEEDWEKEADKLYTWTQGLSVDDLGMFSPF
ncbi:uncharacterized protein CXorf58-like [Saccoglossus kowalevskii]|uniref:Uncharacterized protein n=1 Tax=Saccoglossus kowalevskii TaxID=10224 RepID=A0ABM0GSR3_SACKO|nr:PREDICTED: putative uncharacterized protein CXorf58-like [Saccoglossus kowalevskii]